MVQVNYIRSVSELQGSLSLPSTNVQKSLMSPQPAGQCFGPHTQNCCPKLKLMRIYPPQHNNPPYLQAWLLDSSCALSIVSEDKPLIPKLWQSFSDPTHRTWQRSCVWCLPLIPFCS